MGLLNKKFFFFIPLGFNAFFRIVCFIKQIKSVFSQNYLFISFSVPPLFFYYELHMIIIINFEQLKGSFLFNYLAVHPDYQPFVLSSLAQLFATITKVGWFEDDEFKHITNELSKFIQVILFTD